MKNDEAGIHSLLQQATQDGVVGAAGGTVLTGHLGEVVVAGAAGTAIEDIVATDVTLVTILIDESSSISACGLEDAIRDGHNQLIDAFAGCREKDSILMAVWTFDSAARVVHSFVPIDQAVRLDRNNYAGRGATSLYDTWCDALAANVAYAQRLRDSGTPVRSVVVVITDGEDTTSKRKARQCKALSEDLLRSEQFVLAFVGVGNEADFRAVAKKMGVPDGSVEVQGTATPTALRKTFQLVSRSVIRASQGLIQPGPQTGFFRP